MAKGVIAERTGPVTESRSAGGASWAAPAAVATLLALAIFAGYFVVYPVRHIGLPLGFDPSYYVWRTRYLMSQGLGSGSVAARPGYPVLSALMGSVTGLSQLRLTLVLSLVLVPLIALAVGAFGRCFAVGGRLGWALVVAAAGVILGPTHLVGENLSNALNIALELGALVMVVMAARGGPQVGWSLGAAVALLVAAAITHWVFLPLALAVLGVAFLGVVRPSLRRWAGGEAWWRTEAGLLLVLGGLTTVIMVVVIPVVLRAPFKTIEIAPDEVLFLRKFRTDVARLVVPAILGLMGIGWIPEVRRWAALPGPDGRRAALGLCLLTAWTWVMAAGIVVGAATTVVPPARFLAHLVAVPGAIAAGVVLAIGVRWIARRSSRDSRDSGDAAPSWWPRIASGVAVVVALGALAVPAALRWSRYPLLMSRTTLAQARSAAAYVDTLAEGSPVLFLVDYEGGKPGVYGPILVERTIQVAVDPSRALDVHILPGTLEDLLAGRITPPPTSRAEREIRPLLEDARAAMRSNPPILVLSSTGPSQFADAAAMPGTRALADGVVLVRGPPPAFGGVVAPGSTDGEPAPSLWWGLGWAMVILAVVAIAGLGWTRALLDPSAPVETRVSLVPVIGAAALVMGGTVAARLGVRLEGAGGVLVVATTAGLGWLAAAVRPATR
jgi:hypothetical protein